MAVFLSFFRIKKLFPQLIKTFGVDPDTSRRTAKQVLTRYDETGEPPLNPSKRKSNQHKHSNGAPSTEEKPKPTTLDTSGPIVVSPGKHTVKIPNTLKLGMKFIF